MKIMKNVLMIVMGLVTVWTVLVLFDVVKSARDWKLMVDKQLHQHVFEIDRLERRMGEGLKECVEDAKRR